MDLLLGEGERLADSMVESFSFGLAGDFGASKWTI
jgi:hypothetical protein